MLRQHVTIDNNDDGVQNFVSGQRVAMYKVRVELPQQAVSFKSVMQNKKPLQLLRVHKVCFLEDGSTVVRGQSKAVALHPRCCLCAH